MKRNIIRILSITLLLVVAISGNPVALAVSSLNLPYSFNSTMTDTLGTEYSTTMNVIHSGQTFLYADNASRFATGSTVPTNDDVSLNISLYVWYQKGSGPTYVSDVSAIHIGYAKGNKGYSVSLPGDGIEIDTTRVTTSVIAQSQISKGNAATSGSFSSTYVSPVTGQTYYINLGKGREDIIEHGLDYLD